MDSNNKTLALAADIVAAYVTANTVAAQDIPSLIGSVYSTLRDLGAAPAPQDLAKLAPAVPIKKSITPDFIICLEDGESFKSLKRHIMAKYGLTPDAYRRKWGLAADYPMVAPNYAKARSKLAKDMGLGRASTRNADGEGAGEPLSATGQQAAAPPAKKIKVKPTAAAAGATKAKTKLKPKPNGRRTASNADAAD
jgi:predicted transcriptional regulator